ncbi:MAG: 4a-hydroxytetrahydrobiopterin dehydratase [Myxococcales bacterium]|nr:4a-hydroxytetrahydrobiopterin dehydratase [Myxococcales bacterium]|tara:strand:+ start:83 stop:433 length:351 start_codon:yes stop_codon:yes gene_type:complete
MTEQWLGTRLIEKRCIACEGDIDPLTDEMAERYLEQVEGWEFNESQTVISRTFTFENFKETMAFVNAVAWVAESENHHPDLTVSYRCCGISYQTHAINALTENDFICAAKINALLG